jgi:hypothetical protein
MYLQTKKYCSKCAVLKRQIVSWKSDYYMYLKFYEARDDSNIMISYGTINFEELEMKSTQEMCLSFLTLK